MSYRSTFTKQDRGSILSLIAAADARVALDLGSTDAAALRRLLSNHDAAVRIADATGHAVPLADTDKAPGSAGGQAQSVKISTPDTTEAALSHSIGGPVPPSAALVSALGPEPLRGGQK